MKPFLALVLLCSGCATEVRSRNGVVLLRVAPDVAILDFASIGGGESVTLHMQGHAPSKTIRAAGSVVGTAGSAIVSGITAAAAF